MTHSERIDPIVVSALRRASRVLYETVLLIAFAMAAWWLAHAAGLDVSAPLMKLNTAICLTSLATAGLLMAGGASRVPRGLALVATAIAALTAVEYLAGADLGIDQAIVTDPATEGDPGRMGANTLLAVLLAAGSVLLHGRADARLGQALALASGLVGLLALIGYAIGHAGFVGITDLTKMAAPTAAATVLLALALLSSQPDRGWNMTLAAAGPGGELARRLVPTAIVVPLVVAFVSFRGAEADLWDAASAQWMLILVITGTLLALVFRIARSVQQLELERAAAKERTESFFELSRDLLCTVDEGRRFSELNASWTRVLGYELEELRARPAIEFVHPDDRERTRELLILAMKEPEADIAIENRYRTRDGGWRWLSWSIRPGHDGISIYGRATDITSRKVEDERLIRLARHDGLTGLANRHNFDERLADHLMHASRYGWRGSLLLIDLDGLKETNDAAGHAAGDELLKIAARRMRHGLRRSDLIARIGGDEFAVLLPEADHLTASAVADKLVRMLAREDGSGLKPVASIGVGVIDGAVDAADLLARADRALYIAKRAGGCTFRIAPSEQAAEPDELPAPQVLGVEAVVAP